MRCVRLWTGADGDSHFEIGSLQLERGESGGDLLSGRYPCLSVSFQETPAHGHLDWHVAPNRQFVVTLSGTLVFTTRGKAQFTLRPGDVLLAEDRSGSGHAWRLVDEEPWRRVYVVLDPDVAIRFTADPT